MLKPPEMKGKHRKVVKLMRRDLGNTLNETLTLDTVHVHQKEQEDRLKSSRRGYENNEKSQEEEVAKRITRHLQF